MTTPIFEHQQEMTKILTLETINQNILKTKYAVRGELAIRADRINRVINERIGNNPSNLNFWVLL